MKLFKIVSLIFISHSLICSPTNQEITQKENELARLESDIHYQRYYARSNFLRESTAFTIALSGVIASFVAPKHLVDQKEHKPITTFLRKLGVGTIIFGYTALGATMVKVTRPILWCQEFKRDRLKKNIFDLKASLSTQNV